MSDTANEHRHGQSRLRKRLNAYLQKTNDVIQAKVRITNSSENRVEKEPGCQIGDFSRFLMRAAHRGDVLESFRQGRARARLLMQGTTNSPTVLAVGS